MLVKDPKSGTRTLSSFFSAPAKYDNPPNLYKKPQKKKNLTFSSKNPNERETNSNPLYREEKYFKRSYPFAETEDSVDQNDRREVIGGGHCCCFWERLLFDLGIRAGLEEGLVESLREITGHG